MSSKDLTAGNETAQQRREPGNIKTSLKWRHVKTSKQSLVCSQNNAGFEVNFGWHSRAHVLIGG